MGTHLSAQREIFNEYQHDRVKMVFKDLYIPEPWAKVASALDGLNSNLKWNV